MASFTLIKELCEVLRDNGTKRLLLGLYCASDGDSLSGQTQRRYIALSEQERVNKDAAWKSTRKGITVRRGEVPQIIAALQEADFDDRPGGKQLTNREYAEKYLDW